MKSWVKRTFISSPISSLQAERAELDDYRGSGFDRRHMVTVGDLALRPEISFLSNDLIGCFLALGLFVRYNSVAPSVFRR